MANIKSPYVKVKKKNLVCDRCGKTKTEDKFIPTKTQEGKRFCKVCWNKRGMMSKEELRIIGENLPKCSGGFIVNPNKVKIKK